MSTALKDQSLDEVTLAALRRGCRTAQANVYRRLSTPAWTLAMRISACEDRAWDAVQESFVLAFERIGQLRDPARFGYWLRRILINQLLKERRQLRRLTPVGANHEPSIDCAKDRRLDMERALEQLDHHDRLVVWLHDVEGMTHEEISEQAGHTISWSKSRLSRARRKLGRLLEREPEPRDPLQTTMSISHG